MLVYKVESAYSDISVPGAVEAILGVGSSCAFSGSWSRGEPGLIPPETGTCLTRCFAVPDDSSVALFSEQRQAVPPQDKALWDISFLPMPSISTK
jgi:hypothetical protein